MTAEQDGTDMNLIDFLDAATEYEFLTRGAQEALLDSSEGMFPELLDNHEINEAREFLERLDGLGVNVNSALEIVRNTNGME